MLWDYIQKFHTLTGQNLPLGPIYHSVGLAAHVKSPHLNIGASMHQHVSSLIQTAEYIGSNPKDVGQHFRAKAHLVGQRRHHAESRKRLKSVKEAVTA